MTDKRSFFLDIPVDLLSMEETLHIIHRRIESGIFTEHVDVNTAKIIQAQDDSRLKQCIESCDIVSIDGMGVVWGARLLGIKVPERVAGIDLFYNLLKLSAAHKYSVYLLGAEEEIVHKVQQRIKKLYPDLVVAGYNNGYFWGREKTVVKSIQQSGAQLLIVAISTPKREYFINRWKEQLGVTFVMGVGGTFDVVAGRVKRAPKWMQMSGLEWLYRLLQEPRRLWKRYFTTNIRFVWLMLERLFFQREKSR